MKLKLFEQFIAEGSYKTLADYLVNTPNIKSRLSPTATHKVTGYYVDMFGSIRVDLQLTNISTGKPETTADGLPLTATGEGNGTDISIFLFEALGALSAKITDPKITISSGQFPLPSGVTIPGVKTNLEKRDF